MCATEEQSPPPMGGKFNIEKCFKKSVSVICVHMKYHFSPKEELVLLPETASRASRVANRSLLELIMC